MHNHASRCDSVPSRSSRRSLRCEQIRHDVLTADLNAARARTLELTWEKATLLQRQFMMARQFDRERAASLQMIATLLEMQSRAVGSLEAALQLNAAADCVIALGQAHDRLDVIDARNASQDIGCSDGFVDHITGQMPGVPDVQARYVLGKSDALRRFVVVSIPRGRQKGSS